jgi:hypothetical protein
LFFITFFTAIIYPFQKKVNRNIRIISALTSTLCLFFLVLFHPSRKISESSPESIFLSENGSRVVEPLPSYLLNFVTEGDVVSILTFYSSVFPLPAGGVILEEWLEMDSRNNVFLKEYDESLGKPCASQVTPFQLLQDVGLYNDIDHFYCFIPKHLPNVKPMRVVVFLHGYMGNFQFYQNYFKSLENTVVIAPSTKDLNGRWKEKDISRIINIYLPLINEQVVLNLSDVHVVRLSNGGSGVNVALSKFSNNFKSFTFISAYPEAYVNKRVNVICGKKDSFWEQNENYVKQHSAANVLFFENERHFAFLNKKSEIIDWLKKQL